MRKNQQQQHLCTTRQTYAKMFCMRSGNETVQCELLSSVEFLKRQTLEPKRQPCTFIVKVFSKTEQNETEQM